MIAGRPKYSRTARRTAGRLVQEALSGLSVDEAPKNGMQVVLSVVCKLGRSAMAGSLASPSPEPLTGSIGLNAEQAAEAAGKYPV